MLKGERVTLRAPRAEDALRQHEFEQDIELGSLLCKPLRATNLEQAQAFIAGLSQADENAAHFAIEADGLYIGYCSLFGLRHSLGNLSLEIVIGDRAYWDQGYGREAVRLLLRYAFHYLGRRRVGLMTHVKNERALRCFRACGFVEEGRPRQDFWYQGEYIDMVKMSMMREEWVAKAG
jgi:RimJ/RimL family protein N-acetyltransferase